MSKLNYPVRPPRGTKVSKDTTGRLMHIIAELSVSKSNDDRKRKMLELKKDFDASDVKLIELISKHKDQVSVIMEYFCKVSAKINASRKGCQDVKQKLLACKKLLECKRHEIRRLWTESVEHREVISMMKEIEELNNVNDKVEALLKDQQFLQATDILMASISLLEGKLADADALKDLKSELNTLKKKLHLVLVQELHKYLYTTPETIFMSKELKNKSYEDVFTKRKIMKLPIEGQPYNLSAECSSNYEHIAGILQCIARLNVMQDTVEIIKDKCSYDLTVIIRNTSKHMYEIIQNSPYTCKNISQPLFAGFQRQEHHQNFLLDLLEKILEQFRFVAVNHYAFLHNFQKIAMTKGSGEISNYEICLPDIYSKLQAAVEVFVAEYLDLHNTTSTQRAAEEFAKKLPTSHISSFFTRKNITRSKKHSLFKFESSSHAINKKTYLQEQKQRDMNKEKAELDSIDGDQQIFICEPNAKLITVIYKTLKKFILDIEIALGVEHGNYCPLHAFLIDCVRIFMDDVNIELNRVIERATISLEALTPVTDYEELKLANSKTQILNSTLILSSSLKEIEGLVHSLPDYNSHFLQLMCNILQSYVDLCSKAYRGIIGPESDDNRIFSVSWARDEDISRLLRSLPNWSNLKVDDVPCDSNNFEESPEEIRFRNKEESELLIRTCKDTISPCEIISDHNKLRSIALIHESMEYLSSQILQFAESLPDIQSSVLSLLPDKTNDENDGVGEMTVGISTKVFLKKLARDFEDLADTCLLVLHLEVRAHCFYYLLQLSKTGSYVNRKNDEEPEIQVVRLNTDLSKISEFLTTVLQGKKMKYIFEGVGELISTILMNCVSSIKKINENGVKKMGRNIFAIQQNLSDITNTREVALDRAKRYFDLLNYSYEEILNQIVEKGPHFQELEYASVIQLLHSSREGVYDQEELSVYLRKLRQILDGVAVSV